MERSIERTQDEEEYRENIRWRGEYRESTGLPRTANSTKSGGFYFDV